MPKTERRPWLVWCWRPGAGRWSYWSSYLTEERRDERLEELRAGHAGWRFEKRRHGDSDSAKKGGGDGGHHAYAPPPPPNEVA